MARNPKPLTKAELRTLEALQKRHAAVFKESAYADSVATKTEPHVTASPVFCNTISEVDATLNERGARYGDFTDHARLAQQLQDAMRFHCILRNGEPYYPWNDLTPVMKQALQVDCDKNARILNGDPTYADNWHDKQGYAKLVEDRL